MAKTIVVLGLARLTIPQKIEKARFFVASITGNPAFTTPSPSLASITTAINVLETAYIAAQAGAIDDTAMMHAKEAALDPLLKMLGHYVEGVANTNPLTADATVLSAGMTLKRRSTRVARSFDLRGTDNPGEVKLNTRYAPRATFIWQMSTSPDDESSWQTIGMGTRAGMIKDGLTSGTRYHFRVCVVDKNGQGPWSHVMSIIAQ